MRTTLFTALLATTLLTTVVHAQEMPRPDDRVVFDIMAEDWVSTKTARVMINVEAAMNGANTSSMRADMMKAVNAVAASDWRLTSFNRSQDPTGLEHWSTSFETRLTEAALGGLNDNAKKLSKAGMQLTIGYIDFSPTLDEVETVRGNLRTQLYKKAADQLTALNTAIPGRNFRIANIEFGGATAPQPVQRAMQADMMLKSGGMAMAESPAVERAEKIQLSARVVLATAPQK